MGYALLGSPSPPVNLSYVLTSSAAGSVTVRLEWEAPLDDGGVAIASYQVSVDMSLAAVVSTDTTAILTLDSTGEHHVEITARNICNRVSQAAVIIFNATSIDSITTSASTPTSTETTPSFSSTTNTETNTPATSKISFQIVLA